MYKVNYASIDLKGDIPTFSFNGWKERLSFLTDKIIGSKNKVFLLSINYNSDNDIDDVYVFNIWNCVRFLEEKKYNSNHFAFHLQEYDSYEEAYKVALDMKEENELCYSKDEEKPIDSITNFNIISQN